MNYYLSIIAGDYDNFNNESYINGIKLTYEHKQEKLKKYFSNILGIQHIRYTDTFEINENPNDNFFYFVTDIIDFNIEENAHDWNNIVLKKDCIDKIINNENCFLVFIHENDTLKNNNEASGHVFKSVFKQHPEAEKKGLDSVRKIDDSHVHSLFKNSGLSNWKELCLHRLINHPVWTC